MRIIIITSWIIVFGLLQYIVKEKGTQIPIFTVPLKETLRYCFASLWLYEAVFCAIFGSVLYFIALKVMPLSVAGPLFTIIAALITFLLGIFLYDEAINVIKFAGLSLAVIGILLLYI